MNLAPGLTRRLNRINLPSAVLIALLQRTPVVRIAMMADGTVLSARIGALLKSTLATATAVGAIDTLAGATTIIASTNSPLNATVGQSVSVVFGMNGTQAPPSSWQVGPPQQLPAAPTSGPNIPPGLNFGGLTANGVVNVTSQYGTVVLSGAPTTPGTYTMGLIAYQSPNGQGAASPPYNYTVIVSATNAPVFTTQPQDQSANVGATVTFTAAATGATGYQWQFNNSPISGQTSPTLTLSNIPLSAAGVYSVVASNSLGSTTSGPATLTVVNPTGPPTFTLEPESQTVTSGTNITFNAAATGSPTYQWYFLPTGGGQAAAIPQATQAALQLGAVTPASQGTYYVVAANAYGSTPSASATLVVNSTPLSPYITAYPASQTIASGTSVAFSVSAGGYPAPAYQWQKWVGGAYVNVSGSNITGANDATLLISNAGPGDATNYICVVSNSQGQTDSHALPATLTVTPTNNPGRLVNLSILSSVQGSLSMGFVNGGAGTSGPEPLLIRAIGPSIGPGSPFNVPGVMSDPTLTVTEKNVASPVAANSGWGSPPANISAVETADAATGAFALSNTASADSALVASLAPGQYAAAVEGKSGDSGYALTEVYDDTPPGNYVEGVSPRLVNLSCLTQIAAGGALNVGFVISGTTARTILIRADGPTLAGFGVGGTMPDPQLSVAPLSNSSDVLASDAGWGGDATLAAAAGEVGAFAFAAPSSKDSAVLLTLQPNTPYSVTVTSVSGAAGAVLVELYEVP